MLAFQRKLIRDLAAGDAAAGDGDTVARFTAGQQKIRRVYRLIPAGDGQGTRLRACCDDVFIRGNVRKACCNISDFNAVADFIYFKTLAQQLIFA